MESVLLAVLSFFVHQKIAGVAPGMQLGTSLIL